MVQLEFLFSKELEKRVKELNKEPDNNKMFERSLELSELKRKLAAFESKTFVSSNCKDVSNYQVRKLAFEKNYKMFTHDFHLVEY